MYENLCGCGCVSVYVTVHLCVYLSIWVCVGMGRWMCVFVSVYVCECMGGYDDDSIKDTYDDRN